MNTYHKLVYTTFPSTIVYFTMPLSVCPTKGELDDFDKNVSTVHEAPILKITRSAGAPSDKVPAESLYRRAGAVDILSINISIDK